MALINHTRCIQSPRLQIFQLLAHVVFCEIFQWPQKNLSLRLSLQLFYIIGGKLMLMEIGSVFLSREAVLHLSPCISSLNLIRVGLSVTCTHSVYTVVWIESAIPCLCSKETRQDMGLEVAIMVRVRI